MNIFIIDDISYATKIVENVIPIKNANTKKHIIISAICIAVFLGYVAYDMKAIRYLVAEIGEEKGSIYGAFRLYLDFINIFIRLLDLFGRRN
jgi:FtsH-binding integral membrane protein